MEKVEINIPAMAARAMGLLECGQSAEAINLYREITRVDAANTDAWVMLAAINGELGNVDEAIACCRRAVELEHDNVEANVILGRLLGAKNELREAAGCLKTALEHDSEYGEVWAILASIEGQLGCYEESEKSGRNAIRLVPDAVEGYANLANALIAMERFPEAVEVCSKAIQLDSGNVDMRMTLALAYERAGDMANAERVYREVLQQSSRHVDAKLGIARLLMEKGDLSAAEELLSEALQSEPQYYHLQQLLGRVYELTDKHDKAESCYREVLAMAPEFVDAWINLGNVQQNTGQFDAALSSYAGALRLAPESAEAYYNRGLLEKRLGRFKSALDSFNDAITFSPEFFHPHWNKSFVCLLTGDFEEGWREYEWRLRGEEHIQRPFVQPVWMGEDLSGRTILVHDEQGYGDTFQFVRYLPLVKARGGRVVFECHSKLGPILQGCEGYDQLVERNEPGSTPDVSFDVQVHLMSLPYIFNTRLETIPRHVPYIHPDRDPVEKWKVRLEKDSGFKIGICWAGSPRHTNEAVRSCRLQEFSALSKVDGVSLYSLQKGPALEQIEGLSEQFELVRIDKDMDQDARFVDTAAVIENLDLVISIDTSIVHLAGALGRPVWTLLSTSPDWRWLAEGAASPWYPTMRLFRQAQPGDWAGVFRDVVKDLTEHLNECGG